MAEWSYRDVERRILSLVGGGRTFTVRGVALVLGAAALAGVFLGGVSVGALKQRGDIGGTFVGTMIVAAVYLVPTFVALSQRHRHTLPIFICNVVGGLVYGLGWLAALVWVWRVSPSLAETIVTNPPAMANADTAVERDEP